MFTLGLYYFTSIYQVTISGIYQASWPVQLAQPFNKNSLNMQEVPDNKNYFFSPKYKLYMVFELDNMNSWQQELKL